ncbi:substrate-binding domain-containing protein [Victivallis vadensis]|uniref:Substrate-binding domain-containing protein n=1 Tax=Victivallis vadensis TaxID=172901 RepID=A0A848AXR9_9BACT|nr:substrate-binding domain-containing protein [Victivallis vadensis]NMD85732.1 substrate-binding domain-containing protein [Victivallis vadensis]
MNEKRYIPEIKLDRGGTEPLHLQLSRQITENIFRSRPRPGRSFVSERQLAELLMLNRGTVHRAYEQLIGNGILHQPSGRRTIYIAPEALVKVSPPFPSIGIILPRQFSAFVSGDSPTPLKYLSGIFDRAAELGYAPLPLLLPPPDTPDDEIRNWLKNVLPRLTALIHLGDRGFAVDRPLELVLTENFLPQVFISGYAKDPNIASVFCDLGSAFTALAGYLKENGHHRIGVIGEIFGPNPYFEYTYASRTHRAVAALRDNGMELRDEWIITTALWESPLEPLRKLVRHCGGNLPGVFFCSNDFTADRTINALQELGFRVPEDFSVVGADDTGIAEKAAVPLTTLKVPMYAIGRASVDLVLERFHDGPRESTRLCPIPATLVLRSSVAPLLNNHIL